MSACALLWTSCALAAAQPLRLEAAEDALHVYVGDSLFTTYRFADSQKYPYFEPVLGPMSGAPLTVAGQEPWPHHSSLFFACDKVNGGNYWQDRLRRGQIVHESIDLLEPEGERVRFAHRCLWRQPGAAPILRDERVITITAPSATARIIDFDITLTPLEEVTIEKSNHALFAARMHPTLSVDGGGTLVNAQGDEGEAATFGKQSPWMAGYGTRDGVTEGLAIVQHPASSWAEAPWFTRNYGFFSPTPMNWLGAPITLLPGENVRQRYRVVAFSGTPQLAQIGAIAEAFAASSPAEL